MRRLLSLPVFAVSMVLANPAMAADPKPENEIIEKLNDPDFQEELSSMMNGFLSAMMDIPIGQIAHSVERAVPEDMRRDRDFSDIDPDATIGDLAQRDDPDFERNMESRLRQGTVMMGAMASEFGALLPELQAMGERLKERMDRLD